VTGALVAFASSACFAAGESKAIDKADRALTAAEKLVDRFKQLGLSVAQPGTSPQANDAAPAAADGGSSSSAEAGQANAVAGDQSANDPMAPPRRLVGVHGVRLGSPVAECHELLEQRGWSFSEREKKGSGLAWSKGSMSLGCWPDRRGRVERIAFVQTFASPSEGKFDLGQVRQQLIERYGKPELDQTFNDGQIWITWREGASSPAKPSYGPSLKAEVVSSSMRLNFVWPALAKQVSDDYERNRKAEIDSAPKKKASLD
jgi:hypothetical protein